MNKKGFTLIELLAVLVLIAIVTGITIVSVNSIFDSTKKKSEDAFVATIKDAMEMYLVSTQVKDLSFSDQCTNILVKSHADRVVKYSTITFDEVIKSEYNPITEKDLVNPANKDATCNVDAEVTIYRDEDYVYYYKIDKSEFGCLLNTDATDGYSSVISNLPEGYSC